MCKIFTQLFRNMLGIICDNNIFLISRVKYFVKFTINIQEILQLLFIWYPFQCFVRFPFIWRAVIAPGIRLSASLDEISGLQWAQNYPTCMIMYFKVDLDLSIRITAKSLLDSLLSARHIRIGLATLSS